MAYQIGDSSFMQFSKTGSLKYNSPLHSPVGEALQNELIDEEQAKDHDELHIVNNVLGADDYYLENSNWRKVSSGDILLLVTDGVLDNFLLDELKEIIMCKNVKEICGILTSAAKQSIKPYSNVPFSKIDDLAFICLKPKD